MAKHSVPKKKTSKARSNRRYHSFENATRIKLAESVQVSKCPNCGAVVQLHRACKACGFYGGKDVLGKSKKEETKVTTIKAD